MKSVVKWLFLVSISLILLLLSVQAVTTKFYMNVSEGKYVSHHLVTWDHEYASDNIIDYLNGRIDSLEFSSYPGGDDVLMTERGLLHMEDVAVLFEQGRVLIAFLIVVAAVTGVYLYDKKRIVESLKQIWMFPMIVTLVLGVAILVDFSGTFTLFHKLLFSNDLWILSAYDPLIIMVPPQFFMNTALIILSLFVFLHATIIYIAYRTSVNI